MQVFVSFLSSAKGKVLVIGFLIIFTIYFAIKSQIKKKKIVMYQEKIKEKKKKERNFY